MLLHLCNVLCLIFPKVKTKLWKPLRICSHYVFLKLCFNFSIECFSAMKENRINTGKIEWPSILVSLGLRGTRELGTPSAKICIIGHPSGRHCGRDAKTIGFNTYVSDLALQLTTCFIMGKWLILVLLFSSLYNSDKTMTIYPKEFLWKLNEWLRGEHLQSYL